MSSRKKNISFQIEGGISGELSPGHLFLHLVISKTSSSLFQGAPFAVAAWIAQLIVREPRHYYF